MAMRSQSCSSEIMSVTSARDKFEAAVKVIRSLPKNGSFQPSNEMLLKFYAFYKQATEGHCTAPKPNFWDVVKKAKWEAWNKLGKMSKEEAMSCYVDQLKTIVEAMPQTQLVAEFVEKLGNFYELVDDKAIGEKSEENVRKLNGDVANGDVFKSEPIALTNKDLFPRNEAFVHFSNDVSSNSSVVPELGLDCTPAVTKKTASGHHHHNNNNNNNNNNNGNSSNNNNNHNDHSRAHLNHRYNHSNENDSGNDTGEIRSENGDERETPMTDDSLLPIAGHQVTSDTDSDVEYCDTIDTLQDVSEAIDVLSSTTSSDNEAVFTQSPVKMKRDDPDYNTLHQSANTVLAGIQTSTNITARSVQPDLMVMANANPYAYVPNHRKFSSDSMAVNIASRQSVSEVDHECFVNGIPQDEHQPRPPAAGHDAEMDVTVRGGEEEGPSRRSSRRVSSSSYGISSRNMGRGQGDIGYYPGGVHIPYLGSGAGGAGQPRGSVAMVMNPPNCVTEQIALALSRLQTDLVAVLDRLDTLEEGRRKEKTISSWWPFQDISFKTFLFFTLWPVLVHWMFHIASKRRQQR
ncbi:acyl-CoA-binding domain-containing protein 5 isoform X2 [Octopus sinensis]|uniref:Acyl-CoA-binding domain-containing protein 5 isoform X2 n=1 Tax=Octopus sinensis TaxID=2607531 RepID=A0A6P7SIU9_9MOLL|nr:acyl-CoA-binding domain-containing protein 5 isoform X2 [Octopus sinensis]